MTKINKIYDKNINIIKSFMVKFIDFNYVYTFVSPLIIKKKTENVKAVIIIFSTRDPITLYTTIFSLFSMKN